MLYRISATVIELIRISRESCWRNHSLTISERLIAEGLGRRGGDPKEAELSARAAMAVFNTSYDEWIANDSTGLADLMQQSLSFLRNVLEPTSPAT